MAAAAAQPGRDRRVRDLGCIVIIAVFAPLIAPYPPKQQNLTLIREGCCPGPSKEHLFGVDELGRDEFSRIVYGARYSLLIGVVSVTVGFFFGSILGAIAGFVGGATDSVIMRITDIWLDDPRLPHGDRDRGAPRAGTVRRS